MHIINHKTKELIMNRFFILIFFALSLSVNSSAQHLTYSTFMKIVKTRKLSTLTESLSNMGYVYAGSRSFTNYIKIAWTNNCTDYSFNYDNSFHYEWNTGSLCSVLIAYQYKEPKDYMEFEYYFSSKKIFNYFISGAKNDGFSYYGDSIDNDNIISQYIRVRKDNNTIELIWFSNRKGGDYFIKYFRPYPINLIKKPEDSAYDTNSNIIQQPTNLQNNNSTYDSQLPARHEDRILAAFRQPSISGLEGYSLGYFPTAKCPGSGTVIVKVTVFPSGYVTKASIVGGSNNNSKAREICLGLARQTQFRVPRNQTTEKSGTITYTVK